MKIPRRIRSETALDAIENQYLTDECELREGSYYHKRCGKKLEAAQVRVIVCVPGNDGGEPIEQGRISSWYCPLCDRKKVRYGVYKKVLRVIPSALRNLGMDEAESVFNDPIPRLNGHAIH